MAFTEEQIEALKAKLDGSHVKQREQGGRKVSYVEGWHAIAEANRIFGFDGWTRETLSTECVYSGNYEKPVWRNGQKTGETVTMFRCTYNARVRVTVGDVFRDGSGSGHGFGENPGDAHESAIKEAETDAMKRALMTFGNPFGLALYDKEQADVERPPAQTKPQTSQTTQKSAKSATPPKLGKFELLFPNGEIMAKFDSADEWCHGLRQALTQDGALVTALWERNKPTAEAIQQHYPDVQWADRKGTKWPATVMLEHLVKKLTPGLAA